MPSTPRNDIVTPSTEIIFVTKSSSASEPTASASRSISAASTGGESASSPALEGLDQPSGIRHPAIILRAPPNRPR